MIGRRKAGVLTVALGLLALVAWLDDCTPIDADFSLFYLLPVGLAAWWCGSGWAYALAGLAAGAWFGADLHSGHVYDHWGIPLWNALINLGHFIVIVVLARFIARLRLLSDRDREVSELKSGLVSLVSHEFGNQLTIMQLSLAALEESEGAEPSPRRQQIYARLRRAYAHLSSTTENFLNLNRIEAGVFMPHLGRTPLRTLVHSVIAQMGPLIETSNVKLTLDFPPEHVVVRADPDAISVVLHNIIGNAFKYTPAGGEVTVRISVDLAADAAVVHVRDTGIGMTSAERTLVGSGYYRTQSGRQSAKGFGVGLKVSRELLESMGSQLAVQSEPRRGSDFSFRLPLWRDAPAILARGTR